MALIECREMFPPIRNTMRYALLMPEEGAQAAKAVLWLLPVRRGYANDWVRYTGIELWARRMGLAVVMPEGLSSDFCNMKYGMNWWTFLSEELPEHLKTLFGLPTENNLVFGAEMGALGAVKLALRQPERFAAAGAVGADFTCVAAYARGEIQSHDMEAIYGKLPVAEDMLEACDPLRLAKRCAPSDSPLFLSRSDAGAQAIADAGTHPIRWCEAAASDWEAYGSSLKEFLEKTIAKEG